MSDTQTVYVRFADNGNVRKWDTKPFDGAQSFNASAIRILAGAIVAHSASTPANPVTVTLDMPVEGWELLRAQKNWLAEQTCEEAEGLLNLCDAIQDTAVDSGQVPESIVFPFLHADDYSEAMEVADASDKRRTQCADCGKVWKVEELHSIEDPANRVDAGNPMPPGQCPQCGALCNLLD